MRKPQRLQPGDRVAIVSLSSGILGEDQFIHKFHIAKERLQQDYGLEVIAMPNALKGVNFLYRHPEARAQDLMDAFRDSSIKAVFCAIGGDDTIRLLPHIDFNVLRQNPKIFTGFSDTTTNHFMMRKAGLVSYYGLSVMCNIAEYVSINEYTRAAMEQTLFAPQPTLNIPASSFCSYESDRVDWCPENQCTPIPRFANSGYELLQGSGKVCGELIGGCVDVFPELMGTDLWPRGDEWDGKLLLLETSEADMDPVYLSWFLRGMAAQGIFDRVCGVIVGKPAFRDKYEPYKKVLKQIIGFEANRPDLPILCNVNVGHAYPVGVFCLGLPYELDCDKMTLRLMEPGTR